MKRTSLALASLIALTSITACHKTSSSDDFSFNHNSVSGTYEYQVNGCTTGSHSYSSVEDHCRQLSDDAANNYCATDFRFSEYKEVCKNQ